MAQRLPPLKYAIDFFANNQSTCLILVQKPKTAGIFLQKTKSAPTTSSSTKIYLRKKEGDSRGFKSEIQFHSFSLQV